MIDQSNTPKLELTGKTDNPSIPDLRDLYEERPFCPWLLAGFFFVVPFLLWLLLSKEASASMSQLDLAVQAAVVTLRASAKTTSCFHGPLAVGVDRGRMM